MSWSLPARTRQGIAASRASYFRGAAQDGPACTVCRGSHAAGNCFCYTGLKEHGVLLLPWSGSCNPSRPTQGLHLPERTLQAGLPHRVLRPRELIHEKGIKVPPSPVTGLSRSSDRNTGRVTLGYIQLAHVPGRMKGEFILFG